MPNASLTEREGMEKIRAMVFEAEKRSEDRLWLEPRTDSPNPYYRQTASGLFLELYYGLPNTLWTPWGKYDIGGSGSGNWDAVVAELLPRLGATEYSTLKRTELGEFGPVYALTEIDGESLPEPRVKTRAEFISYEESLASWTAEELKS